jgi:hypothetical protein
LMNMKTWMGRDYIHLEYISTFKHDIDPYCHADPSVHWLLLLTMIDMQYSKDSKVAKFLRPPVGYSIKTASQAWPVGGWLLIF